MMKSKPSQKVRILLYFELFSRLGLLSLLFILGGGLAKSLRTFLLRQVDALWLYIRAQFFC